MKGNPEEAVELWRKKPNSSEPRDRNEIFNAIGCCRAYQDRVLALRFPLRVAVMSFNSRGQYPLVLLL